MSVSVIDATDGRAHIGRMAVSFDTLAAAEAMESVGVEPRQARAIAAQLHAATSAREAVTRPEMEAALAALKTELLDRMTENARGLLDRIRESERGLLDRIAESERGLLERIAESERGLLDRMAENESGLLDRMVESERGLLDRMVESKRGLLDRMAESERGLLDRMAENESGLLDRMAESERRTAALLWRLFGAMVAVAGLAVAVIRYLP